MILIHRLTNFAIENYRKDFIECLNHNLQNQLIKSIVIFSFQKIDLPNSNKIKFFLSPSLTDFDIVNKVKILFKKEVYIFSNPFVKFNNTLSSLENLNSKPISLGNDCFVFNDEVILKRGQMIEETFKDSAIVSKKTFVLRKNYWTEEIKVDKNYKINNKNINEQPVTILKRVGEVITKKIDRIDIVIVSVDYNDYLILTLKNNLQYCKNITIVTSEDDIVCQSICNKFGVKFITTDRMYEDGDKNTFNKGKAINVGLESLVNPDWILLLDADIALPPNFNELISNAMVDKSSLVIANRKFCKEYRHYVDFLDGKDFNGSVEKDTGVGYFQMFHSSKFPNKSVFPENSKNAANSDISFRNSFFGNLKSIGIETIHLGLTRHNWWGRKTDKFISDEIFNELFYKKSTFTICSYYFNFRNDIRQKENFKKFLEQFDGYYDRMIVGLVDYGDSDLDFEIPCEKLVISGDVKNRLWSKEIIINKIIDKIDTDYLIWIDGDLIYEKLDWLNDIDKVTDGNDFVQLFDSINYLNESGEVIETRRSIISSGRKDIDRLLSEGFMPGGSWLGRTSILKKHKLFEQMYVGGGDTIFTYGLFGIRDGWTLARVKENNTKIWRNAINWINSLEKYKIGKLDESVSHLFHGELSKRDYNNRYKKLSKMTNNKIVVYTCISGSYDTLKEVLNPEENIDYVCFTDQNFTSDTWEIKKIPEYLNSIEQTKRARCIKILPHLFLDYYDISVWVDGNIQVKGNINKFIQENLKNSFAIAKHPDRTCVYKESEAVKLLNKDIHSIVDQQIEYYRNSEYPENNGMIQSGVLIRRHNQSNSIEICDDWWKEVMKWSKRDQLAFNYSIYKKKVDVDIFNPSIISSEYFEYWTHSGQKAKLRSNYGQLKNYLNGIEI